MDDLRDLYQQLILDHNQYPQNFREMIDATSKAEGHNPLCGDEITLFLQIENEKIIDAREKDLPLKLAELAWVCELRSYDEKKEKNKSKKKESN